MVYKLIVPLKHIPSEDSMPYTPVPNHHTPSQSSAHQNVIMNPSIVLTAIGHLRAHPCSASARETAAQPQSNCRNHGSATNRHSVSRPRSAYLYVPQPHTLCHAVCPNLAHEVGPDSEAPLAHHRLSRASCVRSGTGREGVGVDGCRMGAGRGGHPTQTPRHLARVEAATQPRHPDT